MASAPLIAPSDDTVVGVAVADLSDRILDASVLLVARWGVAKTSLADVARAAGCSRATVYRTFPGGKSDMFLRLGRRELARYLEQVVVAMEAEERLEDALTAGLVAAADALERHDGAQFVLRHEPGLLLPFLGFKRVEILYAHTAGAVGPHLERFLPAERARWCAEWCARIFLSYLFDPDLTADLTDPDATGRMVEQFVGPAFLSPATLSP